MQCRIPSGVQELPGTFLLLADHLSSGPVQIGRPACPSSRKRRSHLYAVAREAPTPSAVCAGVQPNSTTRVTTSSLPSGVSFAPGWDVRASSSRLELGNPNPNREALPLPTRCAGITASAAKIQEGRPQCFLSGWMASMLLSVFRK